MEKTLKILLKEERERIAMEIQSLHLDSASEEAILAIVLKSE